MVEDNVRLRYAQQLHEDTTKGECQTIEFKKTATSDHEIAEAIAGFATSNAGRIYIGVDNGRFTGVDTVLTGDGRDAFQQRIARISRDIVKPPIRVEISFIRIEEKVVVRLDVPKGDEPVYYSDYRAFTRDLSTTRKLDPTEIKNLYKRYWSAIPDQTINNEQLQFKLQVINQLSDIDLIYFDYADHLIESDFHQLRYDIEATSEKIIALSRNRNARELAINKTLLQLSDNLQNANAHEFYMGMECVIEFGQKLKASASLSSQLYQQIRKDLPQTTIAEFNEVVANTIESFKDEWTMAKGYFERGEAAKIQDSFRRFGYIFHRLGYLPDAQKYGSLPIDLKEVGQKLRNLSSTEKYFLILSGMGSTLDPIIAMVIPIITKVDSLKEQLQT